MDRNRMMDAIEAEQAKRFCPLGCTIGGDFIVETLKHRLTVVDGRNLGLGDRRRLAAYIGGPAVDRIGAMLGLVRMLQKMDLDLHRLEGDL